MWKINHTVNKFACKALVIAWSIQLNLEFNSLKGSYSDVGNFPINETLNKYIFRINLNHMNI